MTTQALNTDIEKPWEQVEEFDDLELRSAASTVKGTDAKLKSIDPHRKLPGMTAEYRQFCNNLSTTIVPLEELQNRVYKPLKSKYPDKFRVGKQEIEFYSAYIVDGKKFYVRLNGKERDIAVQKDIYEQAKRRKFLDMQVQSVRFKLQTKRHKFSSIKTSCDPAKSLVFEGLLKDIELALDKGISCDTTVKQLDRLLEMSWILLFDKDMMKKRKNDAQNRPSNVNVPFHIITDQSSKRVKGNPKEQSCDLYPDDKCTGATNAPAVGKGSTSNSSDDNSDSNRSDTTGWNIEDGDSSSE